MKVLLDTHALLWFTLGDSRLTEAAHIVIEDAESDVLVSPASYWEIAIKVSMGKLELEQSFASFIDRGIRQNGFEILPIEPSHAERVAELPFHHKDPFDRMLVAQTLTEKIAIVSADAVLDQYGVTRIW